VVVQAQGLDLAIPAVYRVPFSTNVERIALAAGHKGVAIEWIDVDERDRSPVEAISGQPLVPVLVHAGEVVTDSPTIVDWLEARVPDPPLYPRDPARRAEVTVFVQWFNRVWKRAPNALVDRFEQADADELHASVAIFDALLAGRDYLFGDFGVADVMAFPFLKYAAFGLAPGDDDPFHEILVEHLVLTKDSPIRPWAERVDAHPRS
jgi:glutathione S-transferase